MTDRKFSSELTEPIDDLQAADYGDGVTPAEGLRLITAFKKIRNAAVRATIIDLLEKMTAEHGKRP